MIEEHRIMFILSPLAKLMMTVGTSKRISELVYAQNKSVNLLSILMEISQTCTYFPAKTFHLFKINYSVVRFHIFSL